VNKYNITNCCQWQSWWL